MKPEQIYAILRREMMKWKGWSQGAKGPPSLETVVVIMMMMLVETVLMMMLMERIVLICYLYIFSPLKPAISNKPPGCNLMIMIIDISWYIMITIFGEDDFAKCKTPVREQSVCSSQRHQKWKQYSLPGRLCYKQYLRRSHFFKGPQ